MPSKRKLKLDSGEETVEGPETERGAWDELPQEILNMIFNHLPVADLFSCSVMSKNWKKASRDVLKRSRECYAHIRHFRQDVRSLNDMIASTDLMQMINGLHIQIRPKTQSGRWQYDFSCSYAEDKFRSKETRWRLEKAKKKLQAVLYGQWRYLNLDMRYSWEQSLSVDDALILREIISEASESLQKVVVGQDIDCHFMLFCGKEFSKLKVLQIQSGDTVKESCMELFVLEFAPNLEEITGEMAHVEVHSPGNPYMLKRLKSIMVVPDDVTPKAGLMEGFRSVSGLHRLDLHRYQRRSSEDVTALFSMVLKSLNTLEELHMYILELSKLFKTSDNLKLLNLRRLSLATHWDTLVADEIEALKLLNLPKLCPNLEYLELTVDICKSFYYDYEENLFEGPYEKSELPVQIEIECRQGLYHHEHLKFLSQLYPKMNKVKVVRWKPDDNSEMNSIFSDLHSLDYLEIQIRVSRWYHNFRPDVAIAAILCGISVQEANILFSGFSRTNFVPIYPSVFNAKNLKELKISGDGYYSGDLITHSWVVEITENLPVRRVRKLIVTFEGTEGLYNQLHDLRALRTLLLLGGAQVKEN